MRARLFWRRAVTAAGLYSSAVLGLLATVVAARSLGLDDFGRFAIVIAGTAFFQSLLDLTVEEALTKYGFRYAESERWGKLHRLFRRALALKLVGGALAAVALAGVAGAANAIFGTNGLTVPFLLAAAIPLVQAPENVGATGLLLQGRYDVRGLFQSLSMALRLVGIGIGAQYGVAEAVLGMALAQAVATAAVGTAGWLSLRRFPPGDEPLGDDVPGLRSFVLQSSLATGLLSMRNVVAPLLLGVVSTPAQVGLFRAAQAPQTGFYTLSSPIRLILLTEQTRDWERGDRARVLGGVRRYTLGAAALMAVALPVLLWLMPDLIRWILGAKYLPATDTARLILVAAAIQLVFGWTKSLPVSIGRPNLRLVTHGVETAVLLPLVVVLGLRWDAEGAAVAVVASAVAFGVAWCVLLLRLRRTLGPAPVGREALAR